MKDLFAQHLPFRVSSRLWVKRDQDRFLGSGRIEIFEKIQEFGSI